MISLNFKFLIMKKKLIFQIVIILILIQFISPEKNDSKNVVNDYTTQLQVPNEVKEIIKTSCADCHSNATNYPWYSKIAPISWYLINHVNGARKKMNFSTWNLYDSEKRADMKKECWEEAHEGDMPLGSYLRFHPEAALSEQDILTLQSWAKGD